MVVVARVAVAAVWWYEGLWCKVFGADANQSKVTFPSVFGLERSRRLAAEATQEAVRALGPLGARGTRLEGLAIYLLERDR